MPTWWLGRVGLVKLARVAISWPEMSSPAPIDVGDALDDLVNQFADPMSFFRELIQNALDAGSPEVDVDIEFEPSSKDPNLGAMIVIVTDYGEGMDRQIIDTQLTRLFSSSKDGDMTKIGKFGIGFVSVFAIEPDAVCVDTARAGEAWRVLFDRSRSFKRLRLDQAMEGTTVRLIKNVARADYEAFVVRAKQVVRYWCGHAQGEVRFAGEVISQPFGLEGAVVVDYKDDFSTIFIGHRRDASTLHAFFNGGLTLVQADETHASAIAELKGLAFKVSSRYLEHTLTRDDVIKDGNFGKVVSRLRDLARGALRERVFADLDAALRSDAWPREAGEGAKQLQVQYAAAYWHLRDNQGLPRAQAKLACARSPSGQIWTWGALRDALDKHDEQLLFASARTPLSDAAEKEGRAVVSSFGGVTEHSKELNVTPLWDFVRAMAFVQSNTKASWLGRSYFMPVLPEAAELRAWQGLATTTARLLEDTDAIDHRIAKVTFGRFGESGSLLEGRAAISQRELGELTPASEAGEVGKGLFSRRRTLVVDADHPVVSTLLGLALREPELAAYQLVKLFLLRSGSIAGEVDAALADLAMGYREARCPRPMS
jgi:hypothetical protein